MSADLRQLTGELLAAARRAIAVALVVDVASDEVHAIRTMLPDQAEMVRVLDVLGWPGSPELPVILSPDDLDTLSTIVSATLILALEETERSAYQALRSAYGTGIDPGPVHALESLASLALWVNADSRITPGRTARSGADPAESDGTPSFSAFASSVTLPAWVTDADFRLTWVNPALQELLGTPLDEITSSPWQRFCDPDDTARAEGAIVSAALEQRNFTVEIGVGPPGGPYSRLLMVCAPRIEDTGKLVGWTGICFDVSSGESREGIRRMIRPLTIASARAALLLEEFPGDIWTTDRDLVITSAMGGTLTPNEAQLGMIGMPMMDVIGDDRPDHPGRQAFEQALDGAPAQYYIDWNGKAVDVRVRPLRSAAGSVIGTIAIGIDISDLVASGQRNAKLREQLELAQLVGDIGSWEVDVVAGTAEWTDQAFRLLGVAPGTVPATLETLMSFVVPEDVSTVSSAYRRVRESGVPEEMIFRINRADGETRTIRSAMRADTDAGTVVRTYGVLQDITELIARDRMAARLSRQLSQAEGIAGVGTWDMDGVDGTLRFSDEMYSILGYAPWLAVPTRELLLSAVHPDDVAAVGEVLELSHAAFARAPRNGDLFEVAFRIVRADGVVRWARLSGAAAIAADGTLLRVGGTLHDVTELRVAALDAARIAGELDLSQGVAQVGSWVLDPRTMVFTWSREMYRVMGYEPGSVTPSVELVLGMVHPDDRDRVAGIIETGFATGEPYAMTHRLVRNDGELRTVHVAARFSEPADGIGPQLFGTVQDITDLVQAQESVAQIDARFAFARDVAGVGTFDFDATTGTGHWSPKALRILGLETEVDDIWGAAFMALVHPDDREYVRNRSREAIISGGDHEHTFRIVRPGGEIRDIRLWIRIESDGPGGPATTAYGAIQDVTEIVSDARTAMRMSHQLEAAAAVSEVAWWEIDLTTGHASGSDGVFEIFGFTPGDPGHTFDETVEMIHPDDRVRVAQHREAMLASDVPGTHDYRIVRYDGTVRTVRSSSSVERSASGVPLRIAGGMRDITEDLAASERLEGTIRKLVLAQELAHLGSWDRNLVAGTEQWADETFRIFGVEPGSIPATPESFLSFVHPDDHAALLAEITTAHAVGVGEPRTFRIIRADGETRIVRTVTQVEADDAGQPIRMNGIIQDVTGMADIQQRAAMLGAKLDAAEATGSVGSWELDTATGRATWSDEMFRLLGLAPGALAPSCEAYRGFVHPDDVAVWRATHNAAVHHGRPGTSTYRVVRADGQIRTMRSAIGIDAGPGGTRLFGTHADITTSDAAADEAEGLMRQLEMTHRLTRTGGWEVDLETGAPTWSEGTFDALGVPRGAAPSSMNTFVSEWVHPDDAESLRATIDGHVRSGIGFVTEFRIRQSDGTWAAIDVMTEFDVDVAGRPTRMRCMAHRTGV